MAWGWNTEGVIANPGANAILADTGPLSGGERVFIVIFWDDAGGFESLLQWRNALNTNNNKQQILPPTLAIGGKLLVRFKLSPSERVRVLNRTILVGNVQVSIFNA